MSALWNGLTTSNFYGMPLANRLSRDSQLQLTGITLLALALRIWGINFGLPYLYHPDEPRYVVIAQDIFKTGDLDPHFFNYPSLFFYLNALAYVLYCFVGKVIGVLNTPADIAPPTLVGPGVGQTLMPATFLLGRVLTVAFGTAAVIIVFIVGRKLTASSASGLLAALLMAISPINVSNSRYITPDMFLVFFTLLAFWGAVGVLQEARPGQYILAGIATGLTASTKYNGGLIVFSLILGHFLHFGLKGLKERCLYVALAACGITFLLGTPFALLDCQKFLTDFQYEVRHYATGHPGFEGDALVWYASHLGRLEGLGAILAAVEIVRGAVIRSKRLILLSAFPLLYLLFISSFVVRFERTMLPMTPFLYILAASLLIAILGWARKLQPISRRVLVYLMGFLIFILTASLAFQTITDAVRLTTIDSRETARIWIDRNIPIGSRIVIEAYSPYVDPQRFSVHAVQRMIDHPPEWYIDNRIDYLVFSEGIFKRFYLEPGKYTIEIAQYDELFRTFDMSKHFTDGGYDIRVYRVVIR